MAPSPTTLDEACGPVWVETPGCPWPSEGLVPGILPSYSTRRTTKTEDRAPSSEGMGIDKIRISFPIDDFEDDDYIWTRNRWKQSGSYDWGDTRHTPIALTPRACLYLSVYRNPHTRQLGASLEFNPSRMIDPNGYGLCDLTDLTYTIGFAWDIASELVTPTCRFGEAKLRRLDVARDGSCSNPAMYVDGLSRVHAPYATKRHIEVNPGSCKPGTLGVGGSTTGHIRFYDKYMSKPSKAAPGDFRFEVQANEGWLENPGNMQTVADLSPDSAKALLVNRWNWAGMSTPIMTKDQWIHVVLAAEIFKASGDPMTEAQKLRFIGYYSALFAGGNVKEPASALKADYRRAIRQLGIFSSSEEGAPKLTAVRHLDFVSGTEVVRAS